MSKPARLILADCPWLYANRHTRRSDNTERKTRFGIGVAVRYSRGVMRVRDLCAMGPLVQAVCADDAVLFQWATGPCLQEAIDVMRAWGFSYSTIAFQWTKTYLKSGQPFRGPGRHVPSNTELVLLGLRGRVWYPNTGRKPLQEIREPHPRLNGKIHHSRKPETLQDRLETWLGPHIGEHGMMELFATRARPGWDCYGWDVTGRDVREDLADHAGALEVAS